MFLRRVVALARSPCIRRCNTNAAKSARTVPKRDIAASSQTKLPKKTIGLVLLGGLGAAIYSGDILPDAIQNPINEGIAEEIVLPPEIGNLDRDLRKPIQGGTILT